MKNTYLHENNSSFYYRIKIVPQVISFSLILFSCNKVKCKFEIREEWQLFLQID